MSACAVEGANMRPSRVLVSLVLAALIVPVVAGDGDEIAKETPEAQAFPATWVGTWRGPCRSGPRAGEGSRFPMELRVAPIEGKDAFTWTIVYGEGARKQVRPYEIHPVDPETGHWRIDEKNGILIDAFLVGDMLFSRFEVMGNRLEARYRMRDGGIDVVISTFSSKPLTESEATGRAIPVRSFELKGVQSGRLVRVKEAGSVRVAPPGR
jgi:hypothetical protein